MLKEEVTPDQLRHLGFDEAPRGVHTSRTMMLSELETVLGALLPVSNPAGVRHAIVEDNLLGKATRSGRVNSAAKLIDLYSFDPNLCLYAAFESLWQNASTSRPVLAVLLAVCRDAVLRAMVPQILAAPVGGRVYKQELYERMVSGFASKYAETTLRSTSRNAASTWKQSGHLNGTTSISRTKAPADYHVLSYALLIGYLRGLRGQYLLTSDWVRLLDFEPHELEAALAEAHRRGLITNRHWGGVIELTPGPQLLIGATA